jgi:hypothetical protein
MSKDPGYSDSKTDTLGSKVRRLELKLTKAIEVINFYAQEKNYESCESGEVYWFIRSEQDEVGKKARDFLDKLEE